MKKKPVNKDTRSGFWSRFIKKKPENKSGNIPENIPENMPESLLGRRTGPVRTMGVIATPESPDDKEIVEIVELEGDVPAPMNPDEDDDLIECGIVPVATDDEIWNDDDAWIDDEDEN